MATLKISDLSVGDWVEASGMAKRVHNIEFQNGEYFVHFSDPDTNSEDYLHAPFIDPIPITAEILENNGFENMGSGLMRYEFELREKKYKIILGSFDEEVWFADFYFMRKKNIDSNIPLFYIHQLQHILRLAGVDKEINL